VLTVVAKLFGIVAPDVAFFGEKDYQQLVLVRGWCATWTSRCRWSGCPPSASPTGWPCPGRNAYLSAADARAPPCSSRRCGAGAGCVGRGPRAVLDAATAVLAEEPAVTVDYLTAHRRGSTPTRSPAKAARLLVAARLGTTRRSTHRRAALGRGRCSSASTSGNTQIAPGSTEDAPDTDA
jgi:pantoate--beta-alanine ligase